MKKHLFNMVEALINDDTDGANNNFRSAVSAKTHKMLMKEMRHPMRRKRDYEDYEYEEDMDDDMDYDMDDEERGDMDDDHDCGDHDEYGDMDYDDDEMDDMPHNMKMGDGYEEMEVMMPQGRKSRMMSRPGNRVRESLDNVYTKRVHKSDSKKYDHAHSKSMSRRVTDHTKAKVKGDVYKDKVHPKNDSKKYDHGHSKSMSRKGLDMAKEGHNSPDGDGVKHNRRTDKTAKYHGKSREGKEV